MKRITVCALALLTSLLAAAAPVSIETKNMTLVINVENGHQPYYIYFGKRLKSNEKDNIQHPRGGRMDIYPAHGMNAPAEAAFSMRHADGNLTTVLTATGFDQKQSGNATVTTIHLKDPLYPTNVDVVYKAYNDVDMIETWTEISNGEKGTVTLIQFASGLLPIRRGDVWMSHLHGSWGNEAQVVEEPLTPGQKIIKNKDGVRNSHTDHA